MKEGKTTKSTVKKKTNNKSSKSVSRNDSEVKVRQVNPVENDFQDVEDDNDKRLIVFIAVGILVVVGTIIGLLVGLKDEKEEPPKKPDDEVVIPTKPEEKNDEEEEIVYGEEKALPIVRKVTKSSKDDEEDENEEETENNNQNESSETSNYEVTYYYGDENKTVSVETGGTVGDFVPSGYENCTYYSDDTKETEIDASTEITESTNVYAVCSVINYTINYDAESSNPVSYNVEMDDITLTDPTDSSKTGYFAGWFLDSNFENEVKIIDKSIVEDGDISENTINIYSKYTDKIQIVYYNEQGGVVMNDEVESETDQYAVKSGQGYCLDGDFEKWTMGDNNNYNEGDLISITEKTELYAVCVVPDTKEDEIVGASSNETENPQESMESLDNDTLTEGNDTEGNNIVDNEEILNNEEKTEEELNQEQNQNDENGEMLNDTLDNDKVNTENDLSSDSTFEDNPENEIINNEDPNKTELDENKVDESSNNESESDNKSDELSNNENDNSNNLVDESKDEKKDDEKENVTEKTENESNEKESVETSSNKEEVNNKVEEVVKEDVTTESTIE